MNVPFVDLKAQYKDIMSQLERAVIKELNDCNYVYSNANSRFEHNLANFVGTNFAIGCSSGTAALHLALTALGIGVGDEVIVPANSFIATALAVSYTGATPVFVDVRSDGLIDCVEVMSALTPNTKAVIPVHLYGNPVDVTKFRMMLPDSVYIIEDAAQSLGALYNGKACGAMGDIGCFSFYPAKNLGACGQGGAITCNSNTIKNKIESLINVGRGNSHYDFEYKGFNYRLDAIKAAFLDVCLSNLRLWNFERNVAAYKYVDLLSCNKNVKHYKPLATSLSTYHLFVISLPSREVRDALKEHLEDCGISTGIHYPIPIHKTKAYKEYNSIILPTSERLADTILSLPMFPTISSEQIEFVCKCINTFIGEI